MLTHTAKSWLANDYAVHGDLPQHDLPQIQVKLTVYVINEVISYSLASHPPNHILLLPPVLWSINQSLNIHCGSLNSSHLISSLTLHLECGYCSTDTLKEGPQAAKTYGALDVHFNVYIYPTLRYWGTFCGYESSPIFINLRHRKFLVLNFLQTPGINGFLSKLNLLQKSCESHYVFVVTIAYGIQLFRGGPTLWRIDIIVINIIQCLIVSA